MDNNENKKTLGDALEGMEEMNHVVGDHMKAALKPIKQQARAVQEAIKSSRNPHVQELTVGQYHMSRGKKVKFSALNVNTLRSLPIHLTDEANTTAQSNFNSMIPSHNLPKLITSNEAAEFLRVTPATVRNMIKDGRIQAIPVGRVGGRAVYRIPLQSLESLLGIDSRDQVTPETRNL